MNEPMIAITKELRDELDSWFTRMNENWRGMNALDRLVFLNKMLHFQDQLRAAPETVSLEEVRPRPAGSFNSAEYVYSELDLDGLVAPIHSGGVVSREAIQEAIEHWENEPGVSFMEAASQAVYALQLTKPVAPVQPIHDQFNSLIFETKDGEKLAVCMRDSGYEFNYQGVWYEAKEGKVAQLGNLHASEVVQPSAVVSREGVEPVGWTWEWILKPDGSNFCPFCGGEIEVRE